MRGLRRQACTASQAEIPRAIWSGLGGLAAAMSGVGPVAEHLWSACDDLGWIGILVADAGTFC